MQRLAPAFFQHGNKALLERLVHFAVEGNAWHADHIIPVYQVAFLATYNCMKLSESNTSEAVHSPFQHRLIIREEEAVA